MTVVHTTAKDSLLAYKAWRNSLVALPIGTVLYWRTGYVGTTASSSVKAGQYTKIIFVRMSNGVSTMKVPDHCYTLALCDKNGREFTRKFYFRVEGIARLLQDGEIQQ